MLVAVLVSLKIKIKTFRGLTSLQNRYITMRISEST